MLGRAYLRVEVRCSMYDKTAIPSNMTFSCGEPDEDGYIEYAAGCYINEKMLKKIFKICERGEED